MANARRGSPYLAALLPLIAFVVYYVSGSRSGSVYDYTFRIAVAFLRGDVGLHEQPPPWLNEMIPLDGEYYSSFPLGSVLAMLPLALLKQVGLIEVFPGAVLAATLAAGASLFFFLLSAKYDDDPSRRIALSLLPVIGTWMWPNLAFAGAWHAALGFAVVGQAGSLYFILVRYRPVLAGLFFALAVGNRTEIVVVTPIFLYLIYRYAHGEGAPSAFAVAQFLAAPCVLGVMTLAYNFVRFSSMFDFGYARIPGVLEEPWYANGIFSIQAIPLNARAMLFETWRRVDGFPYLVPTGFGGSIFLSCPFLIYLFRPGSRDVTLTRIAWIAMAVLTLVLWCHGNPGGWQVSYRYAMVLLPWMFLILLENRPKKITLLEASLFVASVSINAYSTYLFLWTGYVRP